MHCSPATTTSGDRSLRNALKSLNTDALDAADEFDAQVGRPQTSVSPKGRLWSRTTAPNLLRCSRFGRISTALEKCKGHQSNPQARD